MTARGQLKLAYVLIGLGVAAWVPYFVLLLNGADVSVLPFLGLHLAGVLSGAWLRARAGRAMVASEPHKGRVLVGRILIYLGVLVWAPYYALTRGAGSEISIAPFLTAHLLGVLGGGALLISGHFPGRQIEDHEQVD